MVEPDYYAINGLSPLKAFEQGLLSKDEYIGFLKGNIIKYTVRAGKKDDALLDIVKAMDYLHYLHTALKEPETITDKDIQEFREISKDNRIKNIRNTLKKMELG